VAEVTPAFSRTGIIDDRLLQLLPEDDGVAGSPDGIEPRQGQTAWRAAAASLVRTPGLLLSILVIVVVLLWAFAPGWFTGQSPINGIAAEKLQAPSWHHLFGTDELGRDVYTRVVYGTALSMKTAGVAVLIALLIGSVLGLLSGFARGRVDDVITRFLDVLMAIPSLLLAMVIVIALGFGTIEVGVAVGLSSTASLARVMRAEVLRVSSMTFVEAAAVTGTRWIRILTRHVLRNSAGPVLTLATLEFGAAVMSIAALSFLGLGAGPPSPEWGSMIADGRNYLGTNWWLTVLPGVVLVITVVAINRIARALDGTGRLAG
jgi:peptide/nickel transport system permease protein